MPAEAKEEQSPKQNDDEVLELSERHHLEGCPMDPDDLEWEERDAVAGPHAGHTVEIVRCVRCGGQTEKTID
jgi:hypothetical protein